MFEFIDGPDDVIALKMSGKITGADLTAVMDRVDKVMSTDGKVHVFVETSRSVASK